MRVLYMRVINQSVAANSVRISEYGAYGSYRFSNGPYGVESVVQQFIF
jgi:hypothetical protein